MCGARLGKESDFQPILATSVPPYLQNVFLMRKFSDNGTVSKTYFSIFESTSLLHLMTPFYILEEEDS